MIKLSVIIVSYLHSDLVYELLKSIEKYNDIGDELEVIVVDNSPNAQVKVDLSKYNFSFNCIFTQNSQNGFGKGNNVGVDISHGQYLLFLNPDTILVEPIFKNAIKLFGKSDMFGFKLLTPDKKKNFSFRYNYPFTLKSAILNRVYLLFDKYNANKQYIVGADIFIKKDVFIKSGMFDENIFMYNEEFDLSLRVIKNGFKISYFPKYRIIHIEGSGTYEKYDINVRKRFLDSFIFVCQKHNINLKKHLKKQVNFLKLRRFLAGKDSKEKIDSLISLYIPIIKECK